MAVSTHLISRSRLVPACAAAVLVLVLAGCGSSDGGSEAASSGGSDTSETSAPSGGASGDAIAIEDFKFSPTPLKAKVGSSITVTNADGTDHSVTADDKSFDTGEFADGSKSITVDKAGSFSYHCSVHDYMKGVIQVEG